MSCWSSEAARLQAEKEEQERLERQRKLEEIQRLEEKARSLQNKFQTLVQHFYSIPNSLKKIGGISSEQLHVTLISALSVK